MNKIFNFNIVNIVFVAWEYSITTRILVFQIENYTKKNQIWIGIKKTPCHFGQVNFNMSSVIKVVFFISE
jgi:hypothetical protein